MLIADEPTGNLDPDLALEIMQLFKRFNDVGVTVVIATHDVHLIDRFSARRIVLADGRGSPPRAARRLEPAREAPPQAAPSAGHLEMRTGLNTWLARHAQTLMGSLGRFMQHPVATFMTVAVISVALALPSLLNVLLQNTRAASANWNQAFELSVYLTQRAGTDRAEALAKQLRARTDVAGVRVVTAEQAFAEFREILRIRQGARRARQQSVAQYLGGYAFDRSQHFARNRGAQDDDRRVARRRHGAARQ